MNWLIFFLMLPHLKPKCIGYFYPDLYLAIDGLRILSLLIVAGLSLHAFIKVKKLPSPPTWVLGFLEVWICLITILNHGDLVEACSLAVSVMGITLLADLYSDRMREFITSIILNFELITYITLYSVVKWPEQGLVLDMEYNRTPIYFFGPDNWFMYLCIPAVCVALLYLRFQWNKKDWGFKILGCFRAAALIAAAYACVYIKWPATAVVALAVFAVAMLIILIPGVRYLVSYPVVLLSGIAANIAIAVFRVMETVPIITDFIQNKLKKNITLSGRTSIWDAFPLSFDGHVWTGIGVPLDGYFTDIGRRAQDHMHNIIYDMLIQGGIPALVMFSTVLILVGIPLTRYAKKPCARIMTAAMAALLVMCIPEVCRHGLIYLLFPLAWHVDKMENLCAQERLPAKGSEQ